MQSRTSFFNPTIYRKHLTRLAPLWIGYLMLWIVVLPLTILSQGGGPFFRLGDLQRIFLLSAIRGGAVISLLYALFIAMALFSWHYQARSVNAIAALPVRRSAHFLTALLAALTLSVVPNVLVALLGWGAAAAVGLPGFALAAQWLGMVTLQFLFFFGLASLCAAVVGQLLALPVLYLLANFAAVVLNHVTVSVLSTFVYGMPNSGYSILARFSPAFYLLSRVDLAEKTVVEGGETLYFYAFHGWRYLGAVAAVGLVLAGAAFLLFRIRRMEAAGDVIAFRPLRPVFKYCFTVGCSLVLGVLAAITFFSGFNGPHLFVMLLCLLAGGFVGYFASEILLQKSFHVFRREWIGFGVFCACLLAAVGLMEFDVFGFERRVPDADAVERITINGSALWNDAIVADEAYIADFITLHQSIVRDKEEQETLARQRERDPEHVDYTTFDLVYQLKSGKTLVRSYRLYCTEQMWLDAASLPRQYSAIVNEPYIVSLQHIPDFDVSAASVDYSYLSVFDAETCSWNSNPMTSETAYELYRTCILPDIREGLVGHVSPFYFDDTGDTEYAADVYIEFIHVLEDAPDTSRNRVVLDSLRLDVTPAVGSRTADYLQTHGTSLLLRSEANRLQELKYDAYDVAVQ